MCVYHQCVYTDGKWREGCVCIISVFIHGKWREGRVSIISVFIQMVNGGRDVCVSSVCLYTW